MINLSDLTLKRLKTINTQAFYISMLDMVEDRRRFLKRQLKILEDVGSDFEQINNVKGRLQELNVIESKIIKWVKG